MVAATVRLARAASPFVNTACLLTAVLGGVSQAAVMEKCKLLETMPKDNRTATSRALVRLGAAIKDVVRELGERLSGAASNVTSPAACLFSLDSMI